MSHPITDPVTGPSDAPIDLPIDLLATADATLFAPAVQPVLDRYPVAANVLATALALARSGALPVEDPLWLLLSRDGEPLGAGMSTLPGWLFLTPLPAGMAVDGAAAIAAEYRRRGRELSVVGGTVVEATALAQRWHALTGQAPVVRMAQRMYELVELTATARQVPGMARLADENEPEDVAVVRAWLAAFHAEADHDAPRTDSEAVLRDRVRRGLFMLWTHGGTTVSLAGFHPPSAGVARIGPVYTPPEHRRHGYAGAVTAAASRAGLAAGAARCMLYTDLANPTSNGVYQRLGYTPVADAVQYAFE